MKKIFILLLLCFNITLFAYPRHSPQLATPIKMLYGLNETRELLRQAEAQGEITIKTSHFGNNPSNAAWVSQERTIYLNMSNQRTIGNVICSIVFELHNSLSDLQFDYYDTLAQQGKISKENYITAIESIEYVNACQTAQILDKGVQKGIFPTDAQWPIARTFQKHFDIQKRTGHSALIGDMYDELRCSKLSPYNGGFKTETR
jgi:hypothetical protein